MRGRTNMAAGGGTAETITGTLEFSGVIRCDVIYANTDGGTSKQTLQSPTSFIVTMPRGGSFSIHYSYGTLMANDSEFSYSGLTRQTNVNDVYSLNGRQNINTDYFRADEDFTLNITG